MSAIKCHECSHIAPENQGFCPDCGAMYVEPYQYVDDSLLEERKTKKTRQEQQKKKKGGLLSALFGSNPPPEKNTEAFSPPETPVESGVATEEATELQTVDLSFEGLRIRCQECRHTVLANEHEGFCPECGAFFVTPYDYVTEEDLNNPARPKFSIPLTPKEEKPFEDLSNSEKETFLKEQIEDLMDEINNQRHHVNDKANECMQCFTAAGTIKSQNPEEVLGSMIKRRYENLAHFEVLNGEYRRMLEELKDLFNRMIATKQTLRDFQMGQGQIEESNSQPASVEGEKQETEV